ncbi:hypothetical protein GCM10009654_08710 [Streptomyces hebeiensis]|uniref:Uncharacterized protein n=1 Tax=Streptomyces hebeiensis TaxID=229486 RepID=A0ABN1UJU3_9ACTN
MSSNVSLPGDRQATRELEGHEAPTVAGVEGDEGRRRPQSPVMMKETTAQRQIAQA